MTDKLIKVINMYPTRKAFCDIIGVNEVTLCRIMSGKREPTKKFIESILKVFPWGFETCFKITDK